MTIRLGNEQFDDNIDDRIIEAAKNDKTPGEKEKSNPLETALEKTYKTVFREYLSHLSEYAVCNISDFPDDLIDLNKNCRLFRLDKLVLNQKETFLSNLSTVIDTAALVGGSVVTIFHSNGKRNEFYIGVLSRKYKNDSENERRKAILDAVEGAIHSGLMGSQLSLIEQNAGLLSWDCKAICAISAIPAPKRSLEHKDYVIGIERLSDALKGKRFTIISVADPVSPDTLAVVRQGYEDIKTSLSPYARYVCMQGRSDNITLSESLATSLTTSLTESIGKAQSISETYGTSHSTNSSSGFSAGLHAGIPVFGASVGLSRQKGRADAENQAKGYINGINEVTAEMKAEGSIEQKGKALSSGESSSIQFTIENSSIQTLLERVDHHLKRISLCESSGAMQEAVYIMAEDASTATAVAGNYTAILRGDQSGIEQARLNLWNTNESAANGDKDRENNLVLLKKYLQRLSHPRFNGEAGLVTAATLLNSRESAQQLLFPQLPMDGIPVVTMAPFGRNVPTEENGVCLGELCYLGQPCGKKVELNRDSLAAHTFITGSTGSGKSNVIYTMLRRLCFDEKNANTPHFLIIEPAKGEYKNVFGGYDGVTTFGTNVDITQLLKLNPFSFPKGIHVLEHIDRLTEIFNACWPMYAAMPAVLKDAIEEAYMSCGWNLTRSTCVTGQFPTFRTLLKKLPEVLNKSEYSAETKGDYTGALVTRVRELTNGINGLILCASEEISNEVLFDHNVIIDLSRVGSSETKALLMGLLMVKLQEYRMSIPQGENQKLNHITILEEAHHLLRRTSSAQSQDSANLQGKSVEMLTNAIAEMRTYGEGFVIADQAPDLLDKAVIRNTNTKIILRLPDQADRKLVGAAAGLDEQQISELSKLDTGVATVYQNHWPEAVLCHVDEFPKNEKIAYKLVSQNQLDTSCYDAFFKKLLGISNEGENLSAEQADSVRRWIESMDVEQSIKKELVEKINGNQTQDATNILYCLVKGKHLIQRALSVTDPINAQKLADQQIQDVLAVSESVAMEIRKRIFQYAASYVKENSEQADELMLYGGVV